MKHHFQLETLGFELRTGQKTALHEADIEGRSTVDKEDEGITSIKVTFCHSFNQIFITNYDGDLMMSKSERILAVYLGRQMIKIRIYKLKKGHLEVSAAIQKGKDGK